MEFIMKVNHNDKAFYLFSIIHRKNYKFFYKVKYQSFDFKKIQELFNFCINFR